MRLFSEPAGYEAWICCKPQHLGLPSVSNLPDIPKTPANLGYQKTDSGTNQILQEIEVQKISKSWDPRPLSSPATRDLRVLEASVAKGLQLNLEALALHPLFTQLLQCLPLRFPQPFGIFIVSSNVAGNWTIYKIDVIFLVNI